MMVRIRNAGQERESEPVVSKRVFERTIELHKQNCKERIAILHNVNKGLEHNETMLLAKLKFQKSLIFGSSIVSFLVGGGLGWLIH